MSPHDRMRENLLADCSQCFGLCCVALTLTASADFAIDKAAGEPCPNLLADFGCGIHQHLRQRGFPGCTVYDCFGAGQRVAQVTYGGRDWRQAPETAPQMFAVFAAMRNLHELLWYLTEALTMPSAAAVCQQIRKAIDDIRLLTDAGPDELMQTDISVLRREVDELLQRVSGLARAEFGHEKNNRRRSDLIGAKLGGADLRGADLRGSYLIGADLRRADLRSADLLGADLRATDLRGADLRDSLFLTQFQINAAIGDAGTRLPGPLTRPAHWSPSGS